MLLSRRLRLRHLTRLLLPGAVLGLTLTVAPAPARADGFVPPREASLLVSANPVNHTPHAQNGDVRAFAEIGDTVYVGGSFTSIRAAADSTWRSRGYLFAYDRATGALRTAFAPQLDGTVNALAVNPDGKLIVGGAFRNVNGVARRNLVALDPVTGATVTGWVGRGDGGVVRRFVRHGEHLYVGGAFHWINGTEHSLLARLDARTGAVDPAFQIDASVARAASELVWALAVAPDGRTLVATGNFTKVNGLDRNQVVMVELDGTPRVADWSTDRYVPPCAITSFPFYAKDVDFSDDGSYFVIAADGNVSRNAYCDAIARFETADRGHLLPATWVAYTGRDSNTAVEVADGVVYVGGHFRWMNNANGADQPGPGAVDRYGLAALDPNNGMPLNWNPTRSPGGNPPDGADSWGPFVFELWQGAAGLYAGYDADGLGREYHGRFGLLPYAGGRTVPAVDAVDTTPGYLYLGAGEGRVVRTPFDGTTLGTPQIVAQPDLTRARAAFVVANRLYWARLDGTAETGSVLALSTFGNGRIGAPWVGSDYNSWFNAAAMTGAFYRGGRMYYTVAGSNQLFYRYLEHDGYVVGDRAFTVPTRGIAWLTVRGMTLVGGQLVYGSIDGSLRAVPFDPTAAGGYVADGAAAVRLAAPTADVSWSTPTLFYATS